MRRTRLVSRCTDEVLAWQHSTREPLAGDMVYVDMLEGAADEES